MSFRKKQIIVDADTAITPSKMTLAIAIEPNAWVNYVKINIINILL
jgi:hypothetical protein